MNKKEISHLRRQFKPDNEYLTINHLFNVYVQKETGEIFHHESTPFEMLEIETQDLFLNNFKKVLSGTVDAKLFTLKFKRESAMDNAAQHTLYQSIQANNQTDKETLMLEMVEKIFSTKVYDFDTVVTFVQGEYRKPVKKRDPNSDEGGNDHIYFM